MKQPAAFKATYSDWKLVKTRGVVQVIFEVPLADSDAAYEILGGMPNQASERWFGIAAITAEASTRQVKIKGPAENPRNWRDLQPQQQAGIRCEEVLFAHFLEEEHADTWRESGFDAPECVRMICGVGSRSELSTNHAAGVMWHQLDKQYQGWKAMERVA